MTFYENEIHFTNKSVIIQDEKLRKIYNQCKLLHANCTRVTRSDEYIFRINVN